MHAHNQIKYYARTKLVGVKKFFKQFNLLLKYLIFGKVYEHLLKKVMTEVVNVCLLDPVLFD